MKLLNKLYLIYIGDLQDEEGVEEWVGTVSCMIPHLSQQPFSVYLPMVKTVIFLKRLFLTTLENDHVSRLLHYLWTSNKVCLEASTFASINMKNTIFCPGKVVKNTIFWMYRIFGYSLYKHKSVPQGKNAVCAF